MFSVTFLRQQQFYVLLLNLYISLRGNDCNMYFVFDGGCTESISEQKHNNSTRATPNTPACHCVAILHLKTLKLLEFFKNIESA